MKASHYWRKNRLKNPNMNIVIVSDAWYPQINGVVHTLAHARRARPAPGTTSRSSGPTPSARSPARPTRKSGCRCSPGRKLRERLEPAQPDAVHIATEGPLGLAARAWCLKKGFPFTTSFHTQFPEYVKVAYRHTARRQLPLDALVPRSGNNGNGCDADTASTTGGLGVP